MVIVKGSALLMLVEIHRNQQQDVKRWRNK
jgi:hypothetical protein